MKTEVKRLNYDLHLHTNSSDGSLSPQALVDRAVANQLDCIAITDHDTIQSVPIAQNYILKQGYDLTCIAGIELSTKWRSHEIHVVGLNIDIDSPTLLAVLETQKTKRIQRAEQIASKLDRLGFTDSLTKTQILAQGDVVSRLHFAQFLVAEKAVTTVEKAFKQYLSSKGKAYVVPDWIALEQGIETIHQAGGVAVLAHPLRYRLSTASVKKLLRDFKSFTGDGMEVAQNRQSEQELVLLSRWCRELELRASRGSDFHGLSDYHDVGRCRELPDHLTPIWTTWLTL